MVNILVVDDSRTTSEMIKDILIRSGYTKVWTVARAQEALKLVEKMDFQIVFTDLVMPGMTGIELLKELKEISPQTSVIVMTAYPSAKSISDAVESGSYDFIAKPFNEEEIKLAMRRAEERVFLLGQIGQKDLLREQVNLDYLTGVYNHRYFQEVLSEEIERAKRNSLPLSLAVLDIDNFKRYNDTNGHLSGDKLLREIAQFFLERLRNADKVFRYGGEEFTILLPQTFKADAAGLIERIHQEQRKSFPLTVSIGLAAFPEDSRLKDGLIEVADKAMYKAKTLGKDKLYIYSSNV